MEIWKDIEDFKGLYQVSNLGRVKSLERYDNLGRLKKETILKLKKHNEYLQVNLYKNSKYKTSNGFIWKYK